MLECRISTGVLPSAWLVWLSAGCFVQTRSALTQPHKNEHRMVLKPLCEGGEVIFLNSGSTNSSCLRLVIRAIIPMSAMMYYIWAFQIAASVCFGLARSDRWWHDTNLVDPASSHMLVSKIKPCMSQYKLLYGETANGSLKQL